MTLTVSDRFKRQAKLSAPPPVAKEVIAFRQFGGMVVGGSGSSVIVDGDASAFFTTDDTAIVISHAITSEYAITSVNYSAPSGWTTLGLNGYTYDEDADLYSFVARKRILTGYLAKGGIGTLKQAVESQTLNVSDAGAFKLAFLDPDLELYDESDGSGFFYTSDTIWVTVKLGWKGFVDANERPIVMGGIVNNGSISCNRTKKTLAMQCYGYLKRLDYLAAFEVANEEGVFPYLTGVRAVGYDPPVDGSDPVYGPKQLDYTFPDGEALSGISIEEIEEFGTREGPRTLKFFYPDEFQWDRGEIYAIRDSDDVDSQGNKKLEGLASYDQDDYAIVNFGPSGNLARYPSHHTEDMVWVRFNENRTRECIKGRATLKFDGGLEVHIIPDFHAVVSVEDASETYTDHTSEAATPRGTPFNIVHSGDTLYVGAYTRFAGIYFDLAVPATSSINIKVYYSKGVDNWVELSSYIDDTAGLHRSGWIRWQIPEDWRRASVVDPAQGELSEPKWIGPFWMKLQAPSPVPFKYDTQFGQTGSDPGDFADPSGCCVDDDYVYVTDYVRDKVVIYTNTDSPTYVTEFGTTGSGNGQLDKPHDIACDDTYLYVAEWGNGRVSQFLKADPYTFIKHIATGFGYNRCYCVDVDPGAYDANDFVYIGGVESGAPYDDYVTIYEKDGSLADSWQPFADKSYAAIMGIQRCTDPGYIYIINRGYVGYADCEIVRKQKINDHSTIWDWGSGCGSYEADPENGLWHYPYRVVCNGSILVVSAGWGDSGGGATGHVVALIDRHAEHPGNSSAEYLSHIGGSYADGDYAFRDPYVGAWHGEKLYIVDTNNDKVKIYGGEGATCYQMRRLLGLIGKDNDQLTVDAVLEHLPYESLQEEVIIKHGLDESGDVVPVPATWFQLITAHELAGLLLDQAGYSSSIRSIDDMKLEVDAPQLFVHGHVPYLASRFPVTAMCYDGTNDILYFGVGLEIWKLEGHGHFEKVCDVPAPGWTSHEGDYRYETTIVDRYQIIRLAFDETDGVLRGIASHLYDEHYHKQYGAPSVGFEYDLSTQTFESYVTDFKDVGASSHYHGIFLGTHVMRLGYNYSPAEGDDIRKLGQWESYMPGSFHNYGENISLPYDQAITTAIFDPNWHSSSQHSIDFLVMARGIVSRGYYPILYLFAASDYIGTPLTEHIPHRYPHYYTSSGQFNYASDSLTGPEGIYRPLILRYSFGQEGFLIYDEDEERFLMQRGVRDEEPLYEGAHLHWKFGFFRLSDSDFQIAGVSLIRWDAKGTDTQSLCGCKGIDDYYYVAVIQHTDYGFGHASFAPIRILALRHPDNAHPAFYFHPTGEASTMQREGRAYHYEWTEGRWRDVSDDLMTGGVSSPRWAKLNHTGDYLYLGYREAFTSLDFELVEDPAEGTIEVQYWDGNVWLPFQKTGTSAGKAAYYDGTLDFSQSGGWQINIPWGTSPMDFHRWKPAKFYDLDNPGTQSEIANSTDKLYWIRIRMSTLTNNSAEFDKVNGRCMVLWDNWTYDGGVEEDEGDYKGYTILNLCEGETDTSATTLHGCLWNRDDGMETGCSNPMQYLYFVLDIRDSELSFTISKVLSDETDTSISQFKGHVHDPDSDNVYSLLTHPMYRDRGAILVKASYDRSTKVLTLDRCGSLTPNEWGISGKLLIGKNGRVWGVSAPGGILFHYDDFVYPRITIANFGSSMGIREALSQLCQVANCTLRISPDKQAHIEWRDNTVNAADVVALSERDWLVEVKSLDAWPHRYDGVRVQWTDPYGNSGEETSGSVGWEKRTMAISNPFINDRYLAKAMAQVYYGFFQTLRRLLKLKLPFVVWLELRGIFRLYVSAMLSSVPATQGWSISALEVDLKRNEVSCEAIEWDGTEE